MRLEWSLTARDELAEILVWLAINRSPDVAEDARVAVEAAALAAAERPLAYPWVGAIFPPMSRLAKAYRVLAWQRRVHVFYRVYRSEERIVVLHVRGSRRRPLSGLGLTTGNS